MKSQNTNLSKAKTEKNDEFNTRLTDIEKEIYHYRNHFKDKIIFCNCDDPKESEFWKYFHMNFNFFGLKKLITTHFDSTKPTYKMEYTGGNDTDFDYGTITNLLGNGDFRSPECIELLKECDIVVTNPPFSLFREYVATLMQHEKQFVVIGNMNAITYKEIFPLLKDNQLWLGCTSPKEFIKPDKTIQKFGNILWFTNLDVTKRHQTLDLVEKYTPEKYPKYDNYDAININKVLDIPVDYDDTMGVPITFLDKHNPEQFEIIGISGKLAKSFRNLDNKLCSGRFYVNNVRMYDRIVIKRKVIQS